jgi:hypothetical protein
MNLWFYNGQAYKMHVIYLTQTIDTVSITIKIKQDKLYGLKSMHWCIKNKS